MDPQATQPAATTTAPAPAPASAAGSAPVHSVVADHPYPNVPDTTDAQQAATAPGTGGAVGQQEKVPFKEQVNGYAKKIAGTVFGNKDEKELGQAKLEGNA